MLKRAVSLLGARGGGIALSFGFNLLIAQQLPESDYSVAIFYYTLIVLASLIARNGNHIWIPRDMARTSEQGAKTDVAVRGTVQVSLFAGIIAMIVIAYFLVMIPDVGSRSESAIPAAALAIAGSIMAHALCETSAAVFVGLKRPMTAVVISFVLPNLLLLTTAALLPLESFLDYALLLLLSYGAVAVLVLVKGIACSKPRRAFAWRQDLSLSPIREHLPITSVVLVMYLNANMDIFILGILGTPEDMAQFAFVFKIAASIAMLSVLPRVISGPVFTERHHVRDNLGIKREFRRITAVMAFFAVLAGSAILIVFPHIVAFVGKYGGHGGVLYVVLLGAVVNVMFGPLLLLLNMTGNNQSIWKYGAIFMLVKLALLISAYEYLDLFWYGAAGAMTILLWNLLLLRLAARRLGV